MRRSRARPDPARPDHAWRGRVRGHGWACRAHRRHRLPADSGDHQRHDERWDGTGYPRGLRGEEIPIAARIVAVVDVWDALTHERPYKHAWSIEEAAAELRLQAGRHFDPQVVDAFLQVREKGTQIAFDWPSVPPV
ncbi:MAG: hypothetical protein M3434_04500 [Gemmatimonadota bacterium]|nr:hypothetical protein [Gemmatimonadota bacterium]